MNTLLLLLSLDGRISRTTYWVCCMIPCFVIGVLMRPALASPGIRGMVMIAILWPSLALHTKRWHDQNRSGWWQLLCVVPGIGTFATIIMCGFLKGTDGPNDYGPNTDTWD